MNFWDRLTGKVVDATGLGQKKRAVATGITAFDDPISDLRLETEIKSHQWLQDSATTAFLLSVWVAQALQDMAAVLESAAQKQLGEPGKLPEATYLLADGLYSAALAWIEQAQNALAAIGADSYFSLPVGLPAKPPRLEWASDAPPAHFVAVIQATAQLAIAVENALNNAQANRERLPRKYDGAFEAIVRATRVARAKLDQVEAAESDRQAVRLGQDIWAMLQEVVTLYFRAGQQIAMPALIDPKFDAFAQSAARARRLPPAPTPAGPAPAQAGPPHGGQPSATPGSAAWPPAPQPVGPQRSPVQVGSGYAPRGMPAPPATPAAPAPPTLGQRLGLSFDAWDLTDRSAKATYRNDPGRLAELEAFWRADTNPEETRRLFGLITAAVQAGAVAARPGEFSKACPWISTFVALAEVTIGSERFSAGQMFTLKAGVKGEYFGRGFDRLGFVPGTPPPKPKPAEPSGPPRIDTRRDGGRKSRPRVAASPAQPAKRTPAGEEIWLLTAAFQRPQRRASPADSEQLRQLWRDDPEPGRTIGFHDEVLAAVRAGNVRQHGDEGLKDCPWSQVYVAVDRVVVGGVQLERNEKFALQVGMMDGKFRRVIVRLGSVRSSA